MKAGAKVSTTKKGWLDERVIVLSPTPTHPQDFGNRKRIFQVCSHLQEAGAEITFVHYPAEAEWRRANPWSAEQAMKATWAQYFTVAPSRDLHSAPHGAYHDIDEWWDPSIGTFLQWLFSVQSFDTFIVNYAWLSRAFEYAPPSLVRILDTHDKKSGRRELLEAHGIAPEYFFTSEDQERIALDRAHLVWAIKDEERADFSRMSSTPVVTLPHLDPWRPLERPEPDTDGQLRVGFLAARNNINRVNISEFLRTAEPIFSEAFAPIKVSIAGSVCDLMGGVKSPFVELHGRVADVDEFYKTVDCTVIPMTFSTGLKIKTGEAISAALPVVATAHAFEGYEPADKMHTLADFAALAQALVELSFAPRSRLDELAAASQHTYAATAKRIAEAFEATREIARERQQAVVVAVDSRAFVHGTIFNLVLRSIHEYMHSLGNITILVAHGNAADLVAGERMVDEFGRVIVAADVEGAVALKAELAAMHVRTVKADEYMTQKRVKVVIADALNAAFYKPCCADATVFARTEMIALSEGKSSFAVPGEAFRRAFVVSPRYSREIAAAQAKNSASIVFAPCFNRSRELSHPLRANGEAPHIVLLGTPGTQAMDIALALSKGWGLAAKVICALGDPAPVATAEGCYAATDYIDAVVRGGVAAPVFAIDLSGGQMGLQMCQEVLERLRIPVVVASGVGQHRSLGVARLPLTIATEFELAEVFRAFAINPDVRQDPMFQTIRTGMESDRGWAYIWGFCKRLFETQDAEFA